MTINEAFRKGTGILKNAGNEAPANDAGVLLCHAIKRGRTFLYSHGTDELDGELLERYAALLEKRAGGVPLQYLIGFQEFMSLPFKVSRDVLIPRQDTEILVEAVIKLCREKYAGRAGILDIGTGSGCIAVSLAYYMPEAAVTAADLMPEALAAAMENARQNGVADRIRFVESNLFGGIEGGRFEIIVSNPPYIRSEDIAKLPKEIRCHEPAAALDGGPDGLDFYRAILAEAPAFLKEEGMLCFETGYDQAAEVAAFMKESFGEIKIIKDLAGIDRVVVGKSRKR